jgi:GNAT superfamily N-acetyltransferase
VTAAGFRVRRLERRDFDGVIEVCRAVYPDSPSWRTDQLESHLNVFPEGQFVAVEDVSDSVVGVASSLVIRWDDYDIESSWRDFTAHGTFANHDPEHGRTLYGAEVMVHPCRQRRGLGKALYAARRDLARRLRLLRIRAGARLRGYHLHAATMTAAEYVRHVVAGELRDPTLSFQLHEGFRVLGVTDRYLRHDPESLGHAAVIEWLNPEFADAPAAARGTRSCG